VLALLGLSEVAHANPRSAPEIATERTDGIYGRLDGDLTFAVGPEVLYSPMDGRVTLGGAISASFYQLVGLRFGFEQTLSPANSNVVRALTTRLVLSPLFLLRFRDNGESESPLFDLTLDSLNVFVGPVFSEPQGGTFGSSVNMDVGVGFGVPLMARATGLWLRPLGFYRSGPAGDEFVFGATLEYQFLADSGFLPPVPY
jgi:hypothetical protein